jgi:hypothetical protein
MGLPFVSFIVTETAPEMRRPAFAVPTQSIAMMPQPIPLCIANIFTE